MYAYGQTVTKNIILLHYYYYYFYCNRTRVCISRNTHVYNEWNEIPSVQVHRRNRPSSIYCKQRPEHLPRARRIKGAGLIFQKKKKPERRRKTVAAAVVRRYTTITRCTRPRVTSSHITSREYEIHIWNIHTCLCVCVCVYVCFFIVHKSNNMFCGPGQNGY